MPAKAIQPHAQISVCVDAPAWCNPFLGTLAILLQTTSRAQVRGRAKLQTLEQQRVTSCNTL